MLAGNRAAEGHAHFKNFSAEQFGTVKFAFPIGIEQNQGM